MCTQEIFYDIWGMSYFRQKQLPLSCVHCGHEITITIQQIIDEQVFDCTACCKEIALRDQDGMFKQAAEDADKSEVVKN